MAAWRLLFLVVAAPVAAIALILMPLARSLLAVAALALVLFVAYFAFFPPYRALYPTRCPSACTGVRRAPRRSSGAWAWASPWWRVAWSAIARTGSRIRDPLHRGVNPTAPWAGRIAMRAIWNGITIAASDETIVVEGNHYFPPESVHEEHLKRSAVRSLCPWKGIAAYYHLEAGGAKGPNAAWSYRHPLPWIRKIKDHVAFWEGVDVRP